MMSQHALDYSATSFSQGRMDFTWEELSEDERRQAYADYEAGKGLIGAGHTIRECLGIGHCPPVTKKVGRGNVPPPS